jgi:hypothetical protein
VLKGSYDGKKWAVVDKRSDEVFTWRSYTRAFKIDKPGRYAHYRLEVTAGTGASVSLAEVELLAEPRQACTTTVSGRRGPLTVASGVACVDGGTIAGSVVVRPGASLYVTGGTITGSVTSFGAAAVVLTDSTVGGAAGLVATTGEVSLENTKVGGPVFLAGNLGAAALVAGNTVSGPIGCAGNRHAPVNHGLTNQARTAVGQCRGL